MWGCRGELPPRVAQRRGCQRGGEADSELMVIFPGLSTEEGHLNLRSKDGFLEEVMRQNLIRDQKDEEN